jgi:hypothetical protein
MSNLFYACSLILLCQIIQEPVMPAGKRASSAMDGKRKPIHGTWIPAIPTGMTILKNMDHVNRQSRIKTRRGNNHER